MFLKVLLDMVLEVVLKVFYEVLLKWSLNYSRCFVTFANSKDIRVHRAASHLKNYIKDNIKDEFKDESIKVVNITQ